MIFTQNHPTLRRTTGASFCRTELLRAPFESILSTLSRSETYKHIRGTCNHQAHHIYQQKSCFQLFSPYLDIYQNTKEILRKNVSDHFEIIFSQTSRKSWVSEKKYVRIRRTQPAVGPFPTGPVGNMFQKKNASFKLKISVEPSGEKLLKHSN